MNSLMIDIILAVSGSVALVVVIVAVIQLAI